MPSKKRTVEQDPEPAANEDIDMDTSGITLVKEEKQPPIFPAVSASAASVSRAFNYLRIDTRFSVAYFLCILFRAESRSFEEFGAHRTG